MTNCEINGKKYYKMKKVVGHRQDGAPIHKYFYGANKKDAERKYNDWKDAKNEIDTPFDDMARYYVDSILNVLPYAESTIQLYTSAYKRYVQGRIRKTLNTLTAKDIQKLYNELNVTKAVMKSINKFMTGLFKWLSCNGYCANLTENVIVPKKRDNKQSDDIITWTDDELKSIRNNLNDCPKRFLVICAMYTGLRVSELKGLKYGDFTDDFIKVERQCYNGEIKPPKGNSVRSVPMHDIVKEELSIHREKHQTQMIKNHYKTDFVFTSDRGNPLDTSDLRRSLARYYAKIGVPFKKFHAYRATFCTNLCRQGVPIQVASKLLGHKSIEVTSKYYASVSEQETKNAVQKLPLF